MICSVQLMTFSPSHVNLASSITVPLQQQESSYFEYEHFPDGNSLTQYHYEGLFPIHELHCRKPETLGAISYYFGHSFWLAAQQVELHLTVLKVEVFFSKSQWFITLAWETPVSLFGFISCSGWIWICLIIEVTPPESLPKSDSEWVNKAKSAEKSGTWFLKCIGLV